MGTLIKNSNNSFVRRIRMVVAAFVATPLLAFSLVVPAFAATGTTTKLLKSLTKMAPSWQHGSPSYSPIQFLLR